MDPLRINNNHHTHTRRNPFIMRLRIPFPEQFPNRVAIIGLYDVS